MPNDYIDKVKIDANTTVDIKDTVSGYIPSPSGAANGDFLKYNGSAWVAGVVPGGASPSDTTPSEGTETGSAGSSSAYSRGDHSHPKEVLYIEYNGSATLTEIKDWWDAGKAIFVDCNFTSTVGAISLPCVNCTSSLAKFSASWNGVEYWAEFDDVEWDGGEIELLTDTKTSFYGTSTTGATTQAKTTTSITGYALRAGNIVAIKFSNANTYTSAKITLNVSSTGAKDVWYQGAVTSSTNTLTWKAGQTLTFVYTGSIYICISKDDIVPEITFVEYGVSTEAEVYTAQGNGKLVIAFDRNRVRRCAPLVYYAPASKYVFSFVDQDGSVELWELSDNGTNTWSASTGNYYVPKTRTVNSKALSSDITLDASDVGAEIAGLVYDSKTGLASVTALQTQLTTWFNAMAQQTERVFYITFSNSATGTIPFAKGTGIMLHIQRGANLGTATFYGRVGNPATENKIAMMSYVSSAWSEFTSMATTDDINTAIGSAILASY